MTLQITGKCDGGGYWVHCSKGGESFMGVVPDELLEDECGDSADDGERRRWIEQNAAEIEKAMIAQHKGGIVKSRFKRVRAAANL